MAGFAWLLIFPLMTSTVSSQELLLTSTVAHEDFNETLYAMAQNITAERWKTLNGSMIDGFSKFTAGVEKILHKKLVEISGLNDKTTDELAQIIMARVNSGDLTTSALSEIRTVSRALQQVYTKKVIQTFNLAPEELFVTPEYFCDVLDICQNPSDQSGPDDNPTPPEQETNEDSIAKESVDTSEVTQQEPVDVAQERQDRQDSAFDDFEEEAAEPLETASEVLETLAQSSTPANESTQDNVEEPGQDKIEEPIDEQSTENFAQEAEQTEETVEISAETIEPQDPEMQEAKEEVEETVAQDIEEQSGESPLNEEEDSQDTSARRSDSDPNPSMESTTLQPLIDARDGLSQDKLDMTTENSSTEAPVTTEKVEVNDPEAAESVEAEAESNENSSAQFVRFQFALLPVVILTAVF